MPVCLFSYCFHSTLMLLMTAALPTLFFVGLVLVFLFLLFISDFRDALHMTD